MLICAAGDIHGALDRMYADILDFEANLGVTFDVVLHVGDFGIWLDPDRIDKATRKHDGAGDFPKWLAENRRTPRNTVFIKGNHEDFAWLDARGNPGAGHAEILPGLHYLRNGRCMDLETGDETVRVAGVGGCWGPADFDRKSRTLQGYARRHYTSDECQRLHRGHGVDILLTHDAPAGVVFPRHRRGLNWISEAMGLDDLIEETQPDVVFFGHHHTRVTSEVHGVPCLGLNKSGMPGNLVGIDYYSITGSWWILGEWPLVRPKE